MFSSTIRRSVATLTHGTTRHDTQMLPRTTSASGIASRISTLSHARTIENPSVSKPIKSQVRASFNVSSMLSQMSHRNIPKMIHSLKTLSSFSRMQTSLSNAAAVSKQILMPKQFDRVFNVIIDPDEFELDFARTTRTPYGNIALQQLIKRGDIVPATSHLAERNLKSYLPLRQELNRVLSRPTYKGRPDPNINNFKFRDRNRSEGDLMFEKYFITIETFGEEDV